MVTLADLPNDVMDVLVSCFKPHDIWMPVADIIRTVSALAIAGKTMHPLCTKLHAKLAEIVPWDAMNHDEAMFTTLVGGVHASSTLPCMRSLLREWGLKVSGRKVELWARLVQGARDARPLDFPINTTPATHRNIPRMDTFLLQAYGLSGDQMDMGRVREAILAKFGTRQRHDKYMENRHAKLQQLEADKARRRDELVVALRAVGCTLRRDSKLCREYIMSSSSHTLEHVVNTVQELKFFCTYTHYRSILNSLEMEDDDSDSSRDDPLDCSEILVEQAKGVALKRLVKSIGTERALAMSPLSLHIRIRSL